MKSKLNMLPFLKTAKPSKKVKTEKETKAETKAEKDIEEVYGKGKK
jgi:hypothetical protein